MSLRRRFGGWLLIVAGIINLFACGKEEKQTAQLIQLSPEEKQKVITTIYSLQEELNLCEKERDKGISPEAAEVYPLDREKYLVEILCFMGAYQGNYQYLLFFPHNSTVKKISFTTFTMQLENRRLTNSFTLVGTPHFELEKKTLSVYSLARGLGDCGSFARYRWEDFGFKLLEYRSKSKCDGKYLPPEEYPLIYP